MYRNVDSMDELSEGGNRARPVSLLEMMWTYAHGLASLIAVGLAKQTSFEDILRSLDAVGGAVIGAFLPDAGR